MQALLTVGLGIALAVLAGIVRYRRRGALDFGSFAEIIIVSFGIGLGMSNAVIPSVWLIIALPFHGGDVNKSLMPGSDIRSIIYSAVIGAIIGAGFSVYGYLRVLDGGE